MNKTVLTIAIIALLGLVIAGNCGCDKIKNIKGNVAGRVQTSEGRGMGYVSVALINVETGAEVDRQTAEDSGSFLFKEVAAGKYTIKIYDITGGEVPSQFEELNLGPGRTANVEVNVIQ